MYSVLAITAIRINVLRSFLNSACPLLVFDVQPLRHSQKKKKKKPCTFFNTTTAAQEVEAQHSEEGGYQSKAHGFPD